MQQTSADEDARLNGAVVHDTNDLASQLQHALRENAILKAENASLRQRCRDAGEEAQRYDVLCRCFAAATRNFRAVLAQLEEERNDRIKNWLDAAAAEAEHQAQQ